MRLKNLSGGAHPLPVRVLFRLGRLFGLDAPDLGRVLLYRAGFFGRPWGILMQSVMRGRSEWSPGERELFAAFTSVQNRCPF